MGSVPRGWTFGPFRLDEERGLLLQDGEPLVLPPKAYATLALLCRQPGRLFSKQELIDALWPGLHVEENNLEQQVSALRKALGKHAIETVPRRGYRFALEVVPSGPAAARSQTPAVAGEATAPRSGAEPRPTPPPLAASLLRRRALWLGAGAALGIGLVVAIGMARVQEQRPETLAVHSLAVLPFAPVGERSAAADPAIGLGLADAVITRLGGVRGLAVRPTAAVRRFDGAADPVRAGRALGVEAVLQATVRQTSEQVRVRAQLVGVRDDATLWAAQFDLSPREMSQLEDVVAGAVAAQLGARLGDGADPSVALRRDLDAESYRAYLQGRWHWSRRFAPELLAARRCFEGVLARHPEYAPAWAGLADSLLTLGQHDAARQAARRALALDPQLAEPHATLGFLAAFLDRDGVTGEAELQRALALNPSYATAYQWLAFVHVTRRRCGAARAAIAQARDLDPASPTLNTDVAHIEYYCGDLATAERQARAALELDPQFVEGHLVLGEVLEEEGKLEEAATHLAAFIQSDDASGDLYKADLAARRGDVTTAEALLRRAIGRHPNALFYQYARVLGRTGHMDAAYDELQRAVVHGESEVMLLAVDPAAAPLRTDPRVQELMRRLRLT